MSSMSNSACLNRAVELLSLFGEGEGENSSGDAAGANAPESSDEKTAVEESTAGESTDGEGTVEKTAVNETAVDPDDLPFYMDDTPDTPGQATVETDQTDETEERLRTAARVEAVLRRRIADLTVGRRNDAAVNQYRNWLREADELKRELPDFDIEAEIADPRFKALLTGGVDVRTAYRALHGEELVRAALDAERTRMLSEIVRRNARPPENGTSDRSAALGKPDISALTRSQVEAIERRVARGEKVYLR